MSSSMAVPDRAKRHQPRIPFFAPVVASGLRRCWATNLSMGGIGLSAVVDERGPPTCGARLELQLRLGRAKQPLRLAGRVAWRTLVHPDGRVALGIEFQQVPANDRAILAQFVEMHRPRVVVARATPNEQALAARALDHLHIDFVDDVSELTQDLLRGCASILVFHRGELAELTALLDAIWTQYAQGVCLPGEAPMAPITLCTDLDSDLLLPFASEGRRLYEILRRPVDHASLALAVARSCEHWALELELRWASLQLEGSTARQSSPPQLPRTPSSPTIIRVSQPMRQVYELIRTVAVHDVPVLLLGETGTGKELAAREVFALSRRANEPFVAQDCGALSETLLESELFGHVKGAFTGATTDRPGLFQIADGGTIFLDEIQNTTPTLQAKLLRVVEEGEIRPVGSSRVRQVDVRLIVACNRDLRDEVKAQRFRADFFYRLNRFPIELPPLRERAEGIVELARHFATTLPQVLARPPCELDPRFEQALVAHDWPGNVRELRNVIERAILLTPPGQPLRWEVLPDELRGEQATPEPTMTLDDQVNAFACRVIRSALERHDGVIRRAAADLGVNAITLSRRMAKLGLRTK